MRPAAPAATSSCQPTNFGLLLRQVREAMWAHMERELAAAGHALNFSQFMTIKELAHGTAGVTALARSAQLHPAAMTRLLDRLEERGVIERVPDPADRRALHIHLTDAGTGMWRDVDQCGQRVRERALHGMDEATRTQVTRLLEQVRDNLTHED